MKILQINKFYFLRGGTERYFFDLLGALEKRGHIVIPFATKDLKNNPSRYDKYFAEHINVEKFSVKNILKTFYNKQAVKELEELIKKEKPDIAHLHNIAHQISPAIISILKKHGIPVVQTLHDYKLICPNYKLFSQDEICYRCRGGKYYNCVLRKCLKNSRAKSLIAALEAYLHNSTLKTYRKIDLFIAPSRFMKNICVSFEVPENKIIVVNNPIEIQDENKQEKFVAENYILYFGRISAEKGIKTLINAIKQVNDELKLKIAGLGPELKKYKKLAEKSGLKNKIEFVGFKKGEELEKIISGALAVVLPSLWPENMPYSVLESMAMGKTVIASKTGGLPELINDGENGFLFKTGNKNELAEKINDLDNYNLELIGKKAQDKVRQLSLDEHVQKILAIYENQINRAENCTGAVLRHIKM